MYAKRSFIGKKVLKNALYQGLVRFTGYTYLETALK